MLSEIISRANEQQAELAGLSNRLDLIIQYFRPLPDSQHGDIKDPLPEPGFVPGMNDLLARNSLMLSRINEQVQALEDITASGPFPADRDRSQEAVFSVGAALQAKARI